MKNTCFFILFVFANCVTKAQCNAAFTYTVNSDTIQLMDASIHSGTVNYNWTFHWNHCATTVWYSNAPLPFTVNFAGDYEACLTISDTNSSCNSTICHTITVNNAPHPACDASFVYWKDTSSLSTVYLGAGNGNTVCYGKKWLWDFGDGNYDTTFNSTTSHQYAAQATYTVCLKEVTMAGDTCSFCDSVNSTPCSVLLNASFTKTLNNNTATFVGNCSGATNPSYILDFGDGNSTNNPNTSHTYQYNGTYTVCLTYTGDHTCTKTFCDTIKITNALSYPYSCNALFSYSGDSIYGNAIDFFDLSTTNIASRNWTFPGGNPATSTATNVRVTYPVGTYTAYLTVTDQAGITCSYSNTVSMGTNCTGLRANFGLYPDVTPHVWDIYDMSTGAQPLSYSWNWGDGSPSSIGTAPSHTYTQAGWYNVCLTVTDSNGCTSSYCAFDTLYRMNSGSSMISVNVISSVNNIQHNSALINEIYIYPNPATTEFTIKTKRTDKQQIELYDLGGRLVSNGFFTGETKIEVADLSDGVYTLTVKNVNSITKKKIVVRH